MSNQNKECDEGNSEDWHTYAHLLKTKVDNYENINKITFVKNMTDRLKLSLDDIRGITNNNKLKALNSVPSELLPFPINLKDGNRVVLIGIDPVAIVSNCLLDNLQGDVINAYIRKRGEEKPEDFLPPRVAFRVCPLSPKSRKAPSYFKRWREEDGSFGHKANRYEDAFSEPDINYKAGSPVTSVRESNDLSFEPKASTSKVIVSQTVIKSKADLVSTSDKENNVLRCKSKASTSKVTDSQPDDRKCIADSALTSDSESDVLRCRSKTTTSKVVVSKPDIEYKAYSPVTSVRESNVLSFEPEACTSKVPVSQTVIKSKADLVSTSDKENNVLRCKSKASTNKVTDSQPDDRKCIADSALTSDRESDVLRCESKASTSKVAVSKPDIEYKAYSPVTSVRESNVLSFEPEACTSKVPVSQTVIKSKADLVSTSDKESNVLRCKSKASTNKVTDSQPDDCKCIADSALTSARESEVLRCESKASTSKVAVSKPDIDYKAYSPVTSVRECNVLSFKPEASTSKVPFSQTVIKSKADLVSISDKENNVLRCKSKASPPGKVVVSQPDIMYKAYSPITSDRENNVMTFEPKDTTSKVPASQPDMKCNPDSVLISGKERDDSEITSLQTVAIQNEFPDITTQVSHMKEDKPNQSKRHGNVLESPLLKNKQIEISSRPQSSSHHYHANKSLLYSSPQSYHSHTNISSPSIVSGGERIDTDSFPCSDFDSKFQVLGAIDYSYMYSSSPEEFEITHNENVYDNVFVINTDFSLAAKRDSPFLHNKSKKVKSVRIKRMKSKVRNSIRTQDQRKKNLIMRKKRRYLGAKGQK